MRDFKYFWIFLSVLAPIVCGCGLVSLVNGVQLGAVAKFFTFLGLMILAFNNSSYVVCLADDVRKQEGGYEPD